MANKPILKLLKLCLLRTITIRSTLWINVKPNRFTQIVVSGLLLKKIQTSRSFSTLSFIVYFTIFPYHSLIRGVLIHSCSTRAKNFTNYVFCHPQFGGVIQNIETCCAILTPICLCRFFIKITNFIG